MTVLITLTAAGTDTGPFDLYSDLDGYTVPFETGVSKAALLGGYTSLVVPDFTTTIKIKSEGVCINFVELNVVYPTTTTTTTAGPTTTTTTTEAPLYYYETVEFTCSPMCAYVGNSIIISSPTALIPGKYYVGAGAVFLCAGVTGYDVGAVPVTSGPFDGCLDSSCAEPTTTTTTTL